MTIVRSTSTSKTVEISKNGGDSTSIIAMLIQSYQGEKSVLQTKYFSSEKNATKWANKALGN